MLITGEAQMVEILKLKEELEAKIRSLYVDFDNADGADKWKIESQLLEKKVELNKLRRNNKIATKAISAFELIKDVESRPSIPRYETGVVPLDRVLNGGIEIGSFIQLAGASFAGKTHIVIEILSNIANYKKVMFFNFEMGDRRIANRFSKTLLTDDARKNMMIHNDDRELSHIVDEILSASKKGVKFFAIDSKMKIEVGEEKEDHKKFSKISSTFSKLTQENEIIIFLINQVSEDDDKTGRMAFKGSGDQLYDTDLALFYYLDKKNPKARNLICRKNRQDENNFSLSLRLDMYGKTVLNGNTYNVEETVYEHSDNVSMPTMR